LPAQKANSRIFALARAHTSKQTNRSSAYIAQKANSCIEALAHECTAKQTNRSSAYQPKKQTFEYSHLHVNTQLNRQKDLQLTKPKKLTTA
jgi:hypothetical protein